MTTRPSFPTPRLVPAAALVGLWAIGLAAAGNSAPAAAGPPGGRWTTFASGDDVLSVLVDGDDVWAGTRAGGLVRWSGPDGTYAQYLRPQDPIGGNTVFDIARDGDGRLWLATDGGLTLFDPGDPAGSGDEAWFTYDTSNGLGMPSDEVRAVAVVGSTVWVGGVQSQDAATGDWSGGGLGRLDFRSTFDPRDDVWAPIATFERTYREEPGGVSEPGLVSDTINDLLATESGRVWVAAAPHRRYGAGADPSGPQEWQRQHGGMSFLDTGGTFEAADDRWTGFSCELLELTVTCNVRRLAVDPRGRGWAADGGRGVIHFDVELGRLGGQQARFVPPSEAEGDAFVLDLAFGPTDVPALADTVWLATRSGGLAVLDHGGTLANRGDDVWNLDRGSAFGPADGLERERVQAIGRGAGRMWLGLGSQHGVGGGLQAFDVSQLEPLPAWRTHRAPPSNFVTDIAFGGAGSRWEGLVWVATGARGGATGARLFGSGAASLDTGGTSETSDDVWTTYTARGTDDTGALPWSGLASDNVQAIVVDGDAVWLGTAETRWSSADGRYVDGGLSVFDGERWTARPTAGQSGGLGRGGVSSLALGCDGELWVGTGNMWDHQGSGVFVRALGADPHETSADGWTRHRYPQLASSNTTSLAADCDARTMLVGALHHVNSADTGGQVGQWSGGGVAVLDMASGAWRRFGVDDGLVSYGKDGIRGEALAVAVAGAGHYLVGTYGIPEMSAGALVASRPYWPAVINERQGEAWQARVFERAGMASSIAVDPLGAVWLATSRGGMARDSISADNWPSGDGEGGLYTRDAGEWARLTAAGDGLPANDLSVVRVAPDGTVWVGSAGWGLARFDPREAPATPTPELGLPTRTASPTRDPDQPSATQPMTPGTTASPGPSSTAARPTATARWPGGGRCWLPAVMTDGHPPRPALGVRIQLPYCARARP